jgi:hypothetical protein
VCASAHGWRTSSPESARRDGWIEEPCARTRVLVQVRRERSPVTSVVMHVGGAWSAAPEDGTQLGAVPAGEAADFLFSVAERGGAPADEAIGAAVLADSTVRWPRLLALAKQSALPVKARRAAIFWLGQEAGDAATRGLAEVADAPDSDREVADAAVFALSQQPRSEGIPALLRVARTHRDPRVRRTALFWLGQSEDPAAIALFEELLTKR